MTSSPPPIRTDHSNAFANNTMAVRIPDIISETIALNPDYPASIKSRLRALRDEIAGGGPIRRLPVESADDYEAWLDAIERQRHIVDGELTWQNAEWFFAETYAYRCLVEAVRWAEDGRDPFAPKKQAELRGDALWQLLERALQPIPDARGEIGRAVEFALWGNRIDLSYAAALERGTNISPEDLLVDDRPQLLEYVDQLILGRPRSDDGDSIYIVADNAGSELAMDMVLSDCLLRHSNCQVVLYLKAHPTFVSDATVEDVWILLSEMSKRGGPSAELSTRLSDAWRSERLRFLPHRYWNSSILLRDLPAPLRDSINSGQLLIIKGDANYRRAVGDALWPVDTPFHKVMSYLDVPVLCLRTLKSDPIVGLPDSETASKLDSADLQWRVNGRRGLIQFKPQTSNSQ